MARVNSDRSIAAGGGEFQSLHALIYHDRVVVRQDRNEVKFGDTPGLVVKDLPFDGSYSGAG